MKPPALWLVDHDPLVVARTPTLTTEGHDPCSAYVETFWLPVVGPTTTVLLRRFGAWLSAEPCFSIDLSELSKTIGLGEYQGGPTAAVVRALVRMQQFNLARVAHDQFQVVLPVPGLLDRQVRRLPPRLRSAHELAWREL
jgi:hypothetical protein